MIYDAGKPEPGLISAQKYGKVKLLYNQSKYFLMTLNSFEISRQIE
jgi:hypothetical protein